MVENYYSRYFVQISRLVRLLDEVALLCPKVVFESFSHLFARCLIVFWFLLCFCPSSVASIVTQRTGARIRLSQNREFYPGTTDRVLAGRTLPSLISICLLS